MLYGVHVLVETKIFFHFKYYLKGKNSIFFSRKKNDNTQNYNNFKYEIHLLSCSHIFDDIFLVKYFC